METAQQVRNVLVDLLIADAGKLTLEYLGYRDMQRLCCTTKALSLLPKQHKDIVVWLRDLEVLRIMGCPLPLQVRMSSSIRKKNCRILYDCQDGSPLVVGETLYNAFESAWEKGLLFVDDRHDLTPFRFGAVSSTYSHDENTGFREGDAVDCFQDDEDDDYSMEMNEPNTKKPKLAVCNASFCQTKHNTINYLYHVGAQSYCGSCIDASPLLRLKFCCEQRNDATWSVDELPYGKEHDDMSWNVSKHEDWGLQDDEFWVEVYSSMHSRYTREALRWIGVGPR